jgi:SAM-dependent methyltransferase
MEHHLAFLKELVRKGGPDSSEYHELTSWLGTIHAEFKTGIISEKDLQLLRDEMGEALSILTLQGFVYHKPHGYPGDYEIIEKIYLEHTSNDPELRKWDLYFQLQKAPLAVRNRKQYFLDLLNSLEQANSGDSGKRVLNIASGPARDLFEFFSQGKGRTLVFDNVEFDPLAISYAKNLCKEFIEHIHFLHTNAFDFSTTKKYRLIWSAGLFDYLNDKKFIFLLNHVLPLLEDDGELVVGNFSTNNPTLPYMEIFGDWRLRHRTRDQLFSLAKSCNFKDEDICIGQEPEGVNLFLHMKRGKAFINQ